MPSEILNTNVGQFLRRQFVRQITQTKEFSIRKTTPYNPQSNPVERIMREIGKIIQTYANHDYRN